MFISTAGGIPTTTMTVTTSGTNALASGSSSGMVTLVAPIRINSNAVGQGVIPGLVKKKFTFVPEPGTMLLLVAGAAGLVAMGRRRLQR